MHPLKPFTKTVFFLLVSAFSIGCGGGGSDSKSIQPTDNTESTPQKIIASNWSSTGSSARAVSVSGSLSSSKMLSIEVTDKTVIDMEHLQVYLDTDNSTDTGFKFDSEMWTSKSGADYLIEDDALYRSTTNTSEWNWEFVENVTIEKTSSQIKITVPASTLEGLCNIYNLGVVGRDEDWDVQAYYPKSNSMSERIIDYCDTVPNTRPVITLADSTPMIVDQFSPLVVPAATGYDHEDGDISSEITFFASNVDTSKPGVYYITYSLEDSQGLFAVEVQKTVIVRDPSQTQNITLDGLSNDWISVPDLGVSSKGTVKATDDSEFLYLLINHVEDFANMQFYFDTDNNASTGYKTHAGGADYLLENSILYKFTGTSNTQWSWIDVSSLVPIAKGSGIVELAIHKELFGTLGSLIKLAFNASNKDWEVLYSVPSTLTQYDLINVENYPPTAVDDVAFTDSDTPVSINALTNDFDIDGDSTTILSVSQPSKGKATLQGNVSILFDPQGNVGEFNFDYVVTDSNGNTDVGNIKVTVKDINSSPSAVDDEVTTNFGTSLVIDVLANDSDSDNDVLSIVSTYDGASNGEAIIIDQKIEYTPNSGFIGKDVFSYKISDGKNSSTANVTVTVVGPVNNEPKAVNDVATTNLNIPVTIDVLANDSDLDGDVLTVYSVQNPTNGQAVINNGKIRYTPNLGFVGEDSFRYKIYDGKVTSASASIVVTVSPPVNNAPDAVEDAVTANFNVPLMIDVLANDTDPDGDTLSVLSIIQPPVGESVLQPNGQVLFDAKGNVGSISFSYTVSDGKGKTDTTVVTVASIDPSNTSHASWPEITGETVTVKSGQPIFIDVLANDIDADGDTLILDQVDSTNNGTTIKINGGVQYTSTPGFIGTEEFWYGVHDGYGHNGTGKVTVNVIP